MQCMSRSKPPLVYHSQPLFLSPSISTLVPSNIFCQKYKNICNFISFEATEMVLTSKWGRIQPGIQIWHVQVAWRYMAVREPPKDVLKMASGLISPSGLAGHRRQLCNDTFLSSEADRATVCCISWSMLYWYTSLQYHSVLTLTELTLTFKPASRPPPPPRPLNYSASSIRGFKY